MGLFDRLKARLTRTRRALADGISGLFRGGRPIDDALLAELEELLYGADLGPLAGELSEELSRRHRRGELKGEEDVRACLRETLRARFDEAPEEVAFESHPTVILVAGVNGSGKTTSIAKLAHRYREQGKKVVVAACDTFRAAAADQLEIWAGRSGARIVRKGEGADPGAVAFDAVEIERVIRRRIPEAPHEVWLVLDATNGQNAIAQAREFTAAVQVTGLVVAKMDGTARGGALFGIRDALGLPVRYIGTGESMEHLEVFDPDAFVGAVLAE
jgi:fused signal recognition particle receptor